MSKRELLHKKRHFSSAVVGLGSRNRGRRGKRKGTQKEFGIVLATQLNVEFFNFFLILCIMALPFAHKFMVHLMVFKLSLYWEPPKNRGSKLCSDFGKNWISKVKTIPLATILLSSKNPLKKLH